MSQYDQDNFGLLRLEVSLTQITGTNLSGAYPGVGTPTAGVVESFMIDRTSHTVQPASLDGAGSDSLAGG